MSEKLPVFSQTQLNEMNSDDLFDYLGKIMQLFINISGKLLPVEALQYYSVGVQVCDLLYQLTSDSNFEEIAQALQTSTANVQHETLMESARLLRIMRHPN